MPPATKTFLQRWTIDTLAVLVASNVVSGIGYESVPSLLAASLLLGILNAVLKPFMLLLSLPLLLFTLGLFTVVINAGLLFLVGYIMKSFEVRTFEAALKGALVISLVSIVVNSLLGTHSATRVKVSNPKTPRDSGKPPGNGPVIDV
jgi:putative membrane protein